MAEHVAVALLEGEVAMHEQHKHLQNIPPIYYPLVGGRTTCVGATLSRGTPKEDIGSRALAYLLWDCRRTLVPSFGDSARPFHSDASVLPGQQHHNTCSGNQSSTGQTRRRRRGCWRLRVFVGCLPQPPGAVGGFFLSESGRLSPSVLVVSPAVHAYAEV